MKFFLTNHAIERIKERFPIFCQEFNELTSWNIKDGLNNLYPIFKKIMEGCQENKSFLNNTMYMVKLYEKYGFDLEYKMMEVKNEAIVFVLAKKRSEKIFRIVTVVPNEFVPKVVNKKFSDRKRKEKIIEEKVLSFHEKYADYIKNFVESETSKEEIKENESSFEDIVRCALKDGQEKLIDENNYCIRHGDSIFKFNIVGDDIINIKKYYLFDEEAEKCLDLDMKKQIFNDYLDQNKNVKKIVNFSNRISIFEFLYKNNIYHIVFLKTKHDLKNKVRAFNKELMFLEKLDN